MEITIGVQNQTRELVLESPETSAEVTARVTEALTNSPILELTDAKGRKLLIPTASIGYVEIGSEEQPRVGFGGIA